MKFEEIVPLEDAANLGCRIDRYSIGHSGLWIRVENAKGFLAYLYFTPIEFLSAPIHWFGANFSIAAPVDCVNLFIKLDHSLEHATEISKHFNLYEIDKGSYKIQILAGAVELVDHDILAHG